MNRTEVKGTPLLFGVEVPPFPFFCPICGKPVEERYIEIEAHPAILHYLRRGKILYRRQMGYRWRKREKIKVWILQTILKKKMEPLIRFQLLLQGFKS